VTSAVRRAIELERIARAAAAGEDVMVLSCRLKNGGFESCVEMPLRAMREQMGGLITHWLAMIDAGAKMTQAQGSGDRRERLDR
jgi:hypothetical protein